MSFDEFVELLNHGHCCRCETLEDRAEIIRALVDAEMLHECYGIRVGNTTRLYADKLQLYPRETTIVRQGSGLISAVEPDNFLLNGKTTISSSDVLPFTDHKMVPPDTGFSGLYDWA